MNDRNERVILLVDDSISFHGMIDLFLIKQSKDQVYNLISVVTAEEMFATLEKQGDEVDIVLLDISLPDMNGIKACALSQQRYPSLPIIIITASLDKHTKQRALEAGASDYLLKPFDGVQLRYLIDQQLHVTAAT